MDYNYHTHTPRCQHASGTPEEYILRAMENGIKYMGFSDHAPFVFPDGYESGHRVPVSEAEDYISELRQLKEKYADKIDIKIGFEMEYYPAYFEEMLKFVRKLGAEYLILGEHYLYNEHPDGFPSIWENDKTEELKLYVSYVVDAIKTGVFTYVAHPDIFNYTGDDIEAYRREMRKICIASREYDVPLEINFLGIRGDRNYPNDVFLEIAGEEKSPVMFGFDAHSTEAAYDGKSILKAKELVKKYNLNYIGRPEIKSI